MNGGGGYCARCEPRWKCPSCKGVVLNSPAGDLKLACPTCSTWRCSCTGSCCVGKKKSFCSSYSYAEDQRGTSSSEILRICGACAFKRRLCRCTNKSCRHHMGLLCGRHRQEGVLCRSCVPSPSCDCSGCSACGSGSCSRDAKQQSTICVPCARGKLCQYASSQSWQIKFPCETAVAALRECASFDVTNLTGARALRTGALHKVFRGCLFNEVPAAELHSTVSQTFVLLRPDTAHEWTCFSFADYFYNHITAKRHDACRFDAELTAEDFSAIGDMFCVPYGGTFRHCHGEVAHFASVLEDVPHYPFDAPARLRPTYWRLKRAVGAEDVIPASLNSLLLSIVHCLHKKRSVSTELSRWMESLQSFMKIMCDDDIGRSQALDYVSEFFQHTTAEAWSSLPKSFARPRLLHDYEELAARVGYRYCGVFSEDDSLQEGVIPPTITSNRCLFISSKNKDPLSLTGDDIRKDGVRSSYLKLHMGWQNGIPTFKRMNYLIDKYQKLGEGPSLEVDEDPADMSLLQRIAVDFPCAPKLIVQSMFLDVMATRGLRECSDCISVPALVTDLESASSELDAIFYKTAAAVEPSFKKVMELRQKDLQVACDTMTHPTPTLGTSTAGVLGRRKTGDISINYSSGLHVAFTRGLKAMVSDYTDVLSQFAKHEARKQSVALGGTLWMPFFDTCGYSLHGE